MNKLRVFPRRMSLEKNDEGWSGTFQFYKFGKKNWTYRRNFDNFFILAKQIRWTIGFLFHLLGNFGNGVNLFILLIFDNFAPTFQNFGGLNYGNSVIRTWGIAEIIIGTYFSGCIVFETVQIYSRNIFLTFDKNRFDYLLIKSHFELAASETFTSLHSFWRFWKSKWKYFDEKSSLFKILVLFLLLFQFIYDGNTEWTDRSIR